MPKSTITMPDRSTVAKRVKFKLGGRKSTVSALDLTTDALKKILADKTAGKKRKIAEQVLAIRKNT